MAIKTRKNIKLLWNSIIPSICCVAVSLKPNCHGTASSQKDSSKKKKLN
jgi:hypothetical protein